MGRARDRASADLNGQEFILDEDADTSISADTDDQIDIKIAGADDFQFTANTFTAQSGSTIAAQALTATTVTASDDLTVGGTDFFVDTSADKVGIGTATANQLHQKLTIYSSAEAGIQFQNNDTGVTNSTDGCRISVFEDDIQYTNYEASGKHIFNGGSSTASRLEIEADGDVNVKTGNLVIGTSGKGIDFSATSNSSVTGTGNQAELLADYEKGTWTPNDASGANITYAQKQGSYVKIGDQVTAWGYINAPSSVTHTGAIQINGLPFTTASAGDASSGTSARGGGMIAFQNTGDQDVYVLTIRDSQQIEFFNENGQNHSNNLLNGSKTIMFAVTYHTGIA